MEKKSLHQNVDKKNQHSIQKVIKETLKLQYFGVLSTIHENMPHSSLVAFISISDLHYIICASSKFSQTFTNILKNSNVSFFIDNRCNNEKDIANAITIAGIGTANVEEHIEKAIALEYRELYLQRHFYLKDFLDNQATQLIITKIDHFEVVSNFQNVQIVHML